MPSYLEDVAQQSDAQLSTDDRRRTRHSNDYVRRTVERRQWLYNLLKVVLTLASLGEVAIQILRWRQ